MRGHFPILLASLAFLACDKPAAEPPKKEPTPATATAPAPTAPTPTPAAPTPPASAGADWVHPQKLVSIHFPGKPNESEQQADTALGPVKMTMAMFAEETRAFIASAIVYKLPEGGTFDVAKALDGARDGMLGNIKGKATSEKPIELDGFKGREVIFEAPGPQGQSVRGVARVFAGDTPPTAFVASAFRTTDTPDPDAAKFLDSMHIGKGVK